MNVENSKLNAKVNYIINPESASQTNYVEDLGNAWFLLRYFNTPLAPFINTKFEPKATAKAICCLFVEEAIRRNIPVQRTFVNVGEYVECNGRVGQVQRIKGSKVFVLTQDEWESKDCKKI